MDQSVGIGRSAGGARLAERFPQEVLFVRRVFTNEGATIGLLNLVCSDLACNGEQVATIYQKQWKVEEFPSR